MTKVYIRMYIYLSLEALVSLEAISDTDLAGSNHTLKLIVRFGTAW